MRQAANSSYPDRTVAMVRFVAIGLVGLAIVLGAEVISPVLFVVTVCYGAIAVLLLTLAPHLRAQWLAYPVACVDIAFVTSVAALHSDSELPLSALYILPIINAAISGSAPAFAAVILAMISYSVATFLVTGAVTPSAFWLSVVLLGATLLMTTVAARWLAERREKRAWQELLVAARVINAPLDPDQVAARIVDQTRRLFHADRAGLWLVDQSVRPRAAKCFGRLELPADQFSELVGGSRKGSLRGPAPTVAFEYRAQNVRGEAILLRDADQPTAILAVAWTHPPTDRGALRARLRTIARWAEQSLAQAQLHASTCEKLRLEVALQRAATSLGKTTDREAAQTILIEATRSALNMPIALVDGSGNFVAGDSPIPEALVHYSTEHNAEPETGGSVGTNTPLLAPIDDSVALLAIQQGSIRNETAYDCLKRFAQLALDAFERCAAYERLQVELSWLRNTFGEMPEPMAIWDGGGRLVLSSATYSALDLTAAASANLATASNGELVLGEPARVFVVLGKPLPQTRHMVILREVTREREALQAKDELIAIVGHELRTPLTSVQGYTQVMGRQIEIVQRQLKQLNRLIGDFVEASHFQDGHLPLNRQLVSLSELARAAAERFRGAFEGRALRLELSETPLVEGDPFRLAQVLDNLLSNAAKYSPKDPEIVLSSSLHGEQVDIAVHDRGAGIAAENLPHLFERFYRAPNANQAQISGMGLGLSIVRDLVAAHGGRVWAESDGPGQGATFHVRLPVARLTSGAAA